MVSDHMSSEEKHDFSNKDDDTDTIVTHILYHLKDNSKNIIGILTCERKRDPAEAKLSVLRS